MSSDLKRLVNQVGITKENARKLVEGGGLSPSHSFDIEPEDFLERAEEDYQQGGTSASLNSITNSKRAIYSKMDQALAWLGFDATRLKVLKKVELLGSLGFVTPRILKRVTTPRNILEHQYVRPTTEEIEEALDLAALFTESINRHLLTFESFESC